VACTICTAPHTLINGFRSYIPFWLPGVAGADLRPDSKGLIIHNEGQFKKAYIVV
jgi:hypothetical protein